MCYDIQEHNECYDCGKHCFTCWCFSWATQRRTYGEDLCYTPYKHNCEHVRVRSSGEDVIVSCSVHGDIGRTSRGMLPYKGYYERAQYIFQAHVREIESSHVDQEY